MNCSVPLKKPQLRKTMRRTTGYASECSRLALINILRVIFKHRGNCGGEPPKSILPRHPML